MSARTWGELKKFLEENGVTDAHWIDFLDSGGHASFDLVLERDSFSLFSSSATKDSVDDRRDEDV